MNILKLRKMLRITRFIYTPMIMSILNLESVVKIEIKSKKQNFRNPITRVNIYLLNSAELFNSYLANIETYPHYQGNQSVGRTTVYQAKQDGFIKESVFERINFPMPKRYKYLCDKYSQEFFNKYGELAKLNSIKEK